MEKFGAIAQMAVPIVNTIIVARNNCLVVNHCNKIAEIGTIIPIINMNPVAIHWTCATVIWNSFINVVNAIFNNVSFKTAKKAPIMSETIIGITFASGSSTKNSYLFQSILPSALTWNRFSYYSI